MKLHYYIIPVCIGTNLLAQEQAPLCPNLNFGFTHSVYSTICLRSLPEPKPTDNKMKLKKSDMAESQFGFGIGIFLWLPLNAGLFYKPRLEGNFTTTCLKEGPVLFATSFDISASNSFAIALKPANEHGVIYMARNMSCYLTSKQPYLLIGPKVSLKKFDTGFIHKGFQNELAFGIMVGYGINYEFHGTNFAPEISYSLTSTAQNKVKDSRKVLHTISLAINFF
jgi:hypothetical protein